MGFTSLSWVGRGSPSCIQRQSKECHSRGWPAKDQLPWTNHRSFYLFQLDHVGVGELLQTLYLPQVHRLLPGVVLPLHPLDRHLEKVWRGLFKKLQMVYLKPFLQCQPVVLRRRCHRCRLPRLATSHIWWLRDGAVCTIDVRTVTLSMWMLIYDFYVFL